MIRQELAGEKRIAVSLRTVERAVAPLRRELREWTAAIFGERFAKAMNV